MIFMFKTFNSVIHLKICVNPFNVYWSYLYTCDIDSSTRHGYFYWSLLMFSIQDQLIVYVFVLHHCRNPLFLKYILLCDWPWEIRLAKFHNNWCEISLVSVSNAAGKLSNQKTCFDICCNAGVVCFVVTVIHLLLSYLPISDQMIVISQTSFEEYLKVWFPW